MLNHQYVVILVLNYFLLNIINIFFKFTEFVLKLLWYFIELVFVLHCAKGIDQDFVLR